MQTKILWRCVLSVLAIGIAGAAAENIDTPGGVSGSSQPQVIHLDDGTKLTLLGVTTGTRQMAPGYENLRTGNWLYTPNQTPMIWIQVEHESNPTELVVYDKADTACVGLETSTASRAPDGTEIEGFILKAFPRWDKEFIVRARPYRGEISKEQFVVANPAPVTFTNWTAEPLPTTKSDGDLEVTLAKLVAGAPTPSWRGGSLTPTNDPANQCVHLNFDFRQNGQSTTNWDPWPVETFDASGNRVQGLIYAYPTNGVRRIWGRMMDGSYIPPPEHYAMDGYYFQPGLWPDESPWKVRLEFIQISGFSDDEIVTFTNVPVKPGSQKDFDDEWTAWDAGKRERPFAIPDSTVSTPDTRRRDGKTNLPFTIVTGMVKGVHLELLPPLLLQDQYSTGNPKDVSIIIGADPNFNPKGMNLTVVSATDDQGRDLWSFERPAWAGHYSIEFARVHDDIKLLNLTLALHKSRFVEFTVTPTKQ